MNTTRRSMLSAIIVVILTLTFASAHRASASSTSGWYNSTDTCAYYWDASIGGNSAAACPNSAGSFNYYIAQNGQWMLQFVFGTFSDGGSWFWDGATYYYFNASGAFTGTSAGIASGSTSTSQLINDIVGATAVGGGSYSSLTGNSAVDAMFVIPNLAHDHSLDDTIHCQYVIAGACYHD